MKKVLGVLLIVCLLVSTSLLLPACQGEGGEEEEEAQAQAQAQAEARAEANAEARAEGQLPTYQVGEKWVSKYVIGETTYTVTEEVTGEETVEGRVCYTIDMSFDPLKSYTQDGVTGPLTSIKYFVDKATVLYGVKMESSGNYNGTAFTSTETYSYNPWASLFPMELDKEVEVEKTTIQYFDGSQMGDPVVTTEKYKIYGKEGLWLDAGRLTCWKIDIYDGAGNIIQNIWYSYIAKKVVKSTDADGNTMMELKSYSDTITVY